VKHGGGWGKKRSCFFPLWEKEPKTSPIKDAAFLTDRLAISESKKRGMWCRGTGKLDAHRGKGLVPRQIAGKNLEGKGEKHQLLSGVLLSQRGRQGKESGLEAAKRGARCRRGNCW